MIAVWLTARYQDGGRVLQGADCWGLVLGACRDMGWPPPPDPGGAYRSVSARRTAFAEGYDPGAWTVHDRPCEGAVAAMPEFARCLHAGLCLGGGVLELSRKDGASWTPYFKLAGRQMEYATWQPSV